MTLKQLRYLREIVRQGLHLSQAAAALHTSQPGISRQIRMLEEELGVVVFKRKRNRILGLTAPGQEIARLAEQTLQGAGNIMSVGREHQNEGLGSLVVSATHTQARYTLPPVIRRFMRRFPGVQLEFRQGNREAVFQHVRSGEADLAVGTSYSTAFDGLVLLPYRALNRSVVTQPGHPLLKRRRLTLEDIAAYPIITYGFEANGRWRFSREFEERGLKPNIVFTAVDADVSKAYVELGVGIAILADVAFDRKRDKNLRAIDASHLFRPEAIYIGISKKLFLRRYILAFIEMLAPGLTRSEVERALGEELRA